MSDIYLQRELDRYADLSHRLKTALDKPDEMKMSYVEWAKVCRTAYDEYIKLNKWYDEKLQEIEKLRKERDELHQKLIYSMGGGR